MEKVGVGFIELCCLSKYAWDIWEERKGDFGERIWVKGVCVVWI
jgi:hypothetical protein